MRVFQYVNLLQMSEHNIFNSVLTYLQSRITMMHTQYIIITNTKYYCNLTQIIFQHKILIFHSILQYNMSQHLDI